ncbi:type IV pilus biogenesis protein PilP (plasmid) [Burkholderia gladioli]|uniref:type IV pilus biogenesis protein PilP n=1 Tax=Burkholderia gladioli TaxID=28095 RepID=UPI001364CA17|nr:type IV pilus biogenesis protein PilP [Burkholderia gladioli]WAG21734.1 type IV pilus biogenesis protein PilP [Burkholderia gladioli]
MTRSTLRLLTPLCLMAVLVPAAHAGGLVATASSAAVASAPTAAPTAAVVEPSAIAPAASTTIAAPRAVKSVNAQLDDELARTPLLRAQKENADLERAIREANQPKATPSASSGAGPSTCAPNAAPAAPIVTTPSPSPEISKRAGPPMADLSFVGAGAFNGKWIATVADDSGVFYDVQIGDILPSGWKVTQIDPLFVQLERGRQRRQIRSTS